MNILIFFSIKIQHFLSVTTCHLMTVAQVECNECNARLDISFSFKLSTLSKLFSALIWMNIPQSAVKNLQINDDGPELMHAFSWFSMKIVGSNLVDHYVMFVGCVYVYVASRKKREIEFLLLEFEVSKKFVTFKMRSKCFKFFFLCHSFFWFYCYSSCFLICLE